MTKMEVRTGDSTDLASAILDTVKLWFLIEAPDQPNERAVAVVAALMVAVALCSHEDSPLSPEGATAAVQDLVERVELLTLPSVTTA